MADLCLVDTFTDKFLHSLELLVTVLIILVLVALFFPLGRMVIQKAHGVKCVSNLRTIGQAFHAFIAENNGRFPPSRARVGNDGNGNAIAQNYWIYSAYFSDDYKGSAPASNGLHPIKYFDYKEPNSTEMKKSGKTYKDAGVFWCPADNDPAVRPITFAAQSYAVNSYYVGGASAFPINAVTGEPEANYTPAHARLSAVPRPSEIIYIMDHYAITPQTYNGHASHLSWPFNKGSKKEPTDTDKNRVAFIRHGGVANALFLDGGVRALTFDQIAGTYLKYFDAREQIKEIEKGK